MREIHKNSRINDSAMPLQRPLLLRWIHRTGDQLTTIWDMRCLTDTRQGRQRAISPEWL